MVAKVGHWSMLQQCLSHGLVHDFQKHHFFTVEKVASLTSGGPSDYFAFIKHKSQLFFDSFKAGDTHFLGRLSQLRTDSFQTK